MMTPYQKIRHYERVIRRYLQFGSLAAIVVVVGYLWITYGSNHYEWRQKLTVEVSTPAGEVSGSSIQDVLVIKARNTFAGHLPNSHAAVTGEAVVVEVSEGRYLFALLKPANDRVGMKGIGDILTKVAAPGQPARTHPALKVSDRQPVGARFTVPEKYYPLLVTFDDLKDPKSVKRVDPTDLAAHFGPGYALKSISLEVTDEPVTEGRPASILSWLAEYQARGWTLGGEKKIAYRVDDAFTDRVTTSVFMIGQENE